MDKKNEWKECEGKVKDESMKVRMNYICFISHIHLIIKENVHYNCDIVS